MRNPHNINPRKDETTKTVGICSADTLERERSLMIFELILLLLTGGAVAWMSKGEERDRDYSRHRSSFSDYSSNFSRDSDFDDILRSLRNGREDSTLRSNSSYPYLSSSIFNSREDTPRFDFSIPTPTFSPRLREPTRYRYDKWTGVLEEDD